jgi:hypothetical protein
MNNPEHLKWIVLGALVGFGASFTFGDLITLPLDLYYLIYFGFSQSNRLTNNSCNHGHSGCYPLPQNRTLPATPPGMMKKWNWEGPCPLR